MEAAMRDMERDFGGMDTDNPDPRQLARMMRKVSELTGDATPPQMEELIRRMEAGEDPEKLENEFGDLMDEAEGMADTGMSAEKSRTARRRNEAMITRDPTLYDMGEFGDKRLGASAVDPLRRSHGRARRGRGGAAPVARRIGPDAIPAYGPALFRWPARRSVAGNGGGGPGHRIAIAASTKASRRSLGQ